MRPASGAVIGCGMVQAIEALYVHHGCHRTGSSTVRGSLKPADQFHKVEGQPTSTESEESQKREAEAREDELRHEAEVAEADAYWLRKAEENDWDCIRPDMSVYRYCGVELTEDPRRTPEYRKEVLEGLGFGEGATREGLTEADMAACREVISRKAGAFWIEGKHRTTLRYLLHDTIPTGPPCRTPPHRLKGEEAEGVDAQLQADVQRGQLIRGNSEWARPHFATKAFAEHRR